MTNGQYLNKIMKEAFKVSIRPENHRWHIWDCSDVRCSTCQFNDRCTSKGIDAWLDEEYKGEASGTPIKTYEEGVEEGRQQVYRELSRMFIREEKE